MIPIEFLIGVVVIITVIAAMAIPVILIQDWADRMALMNSPLREDSE